MQITWEILTLRTRTDYWLTVSYGQSSDVWQPAK
jgi:hypothetical protein